MDLKIQQIKAPEILEVVPFTGPRMWITSDGNIFHNPDEAQKNAENFSQKG